MMISKLAAKQLIMKTLHFYMLSLLLAVFHAPGCTVPQHIDTYRVPEFKPDGTFKVISLNSADPLLLALEQELLSQGFKVIADNYLRSQAVPAGNVTISTHDTTYNTMQYRPVGLEMFKEKSSDYVIRYVVKWRITGRAINNFRASVINTTTGAVEYTYNFDNGYNTSDPTFREMEAVVKDFVSKMGRKQQ